MLRNQMLRSIHAVTLHYPMLPKFHGAGWSSEIVQQGHTQRLWLRRIAAGGPLSMWFILSIRQYDTAIREIYQILVLKMTLDGVC